MTKRSIVIIPTDDTTPDVRLNLTRVVAVDVQKKFIILEEIKDGEWRLTYTKNVIEDISKVAAFIIDRETE